MHYVQFSLFYSSMRYFVFGEKFVFHFNWQLVNSKQEVKWNMSRNHVKMWIDVPVIFGFVNYINEQSASNVCSYIFPNELHNFDKTSCSMCVFLIDIIIVYTRMNKTSSKYKLEWESDQYIWMKRENIVLPFLWKKRRFKVWIPNHIDVYICIYFGLVSNSVPFKKKNKP